MIRKRQAQGIATARGAYENRKRAKKVSQKRIAKLKADGLNNIEIAEYLNISRMTAHGALNKQAEVTA